MNQKWILSDVTINDTNSLPGLTLSVLYNNYQTEKLNDLGIGYVLYNDQADQVTLVKGNCLISIHLVKIK